MYILVVGDPMNGLSFYGPFASYRLANDWGDEQEWADTTTFWPALLNSAQRSGATCVYEGIKP